MIRRSLLIIVGLILLWQVIVLLFNFPSYILPSPWQVFESFKNNFGLILSNTIPTVIETFSGLLLGIFLGSLLAIIMYLIPSIGYWLLPLMVISQAVPTFAVAPILVLWFGYGMLSKIATITLMLFFPVASALYYGLKQTSSDWLDLAKVMHGKKSKVLWHLQLPGAKPYFANGVRVAVVLAPIGAIVSEWIGASKGLGFLMLNANARLAIDLMFACVIVIMVLAMALYGLVNLLLKA